MPLPSGCSNFRLGPVKKTSSGVTPYRLDFSKFLASLQLQISQNPDILSSFSLTVVTPAAGISIISQAFDSRNIYMQIGGGIVGHTAIIEVAINTFNGNRDTFSLRLEVE